MIKLNKVTIQDINHFIENKYKTNMGQIGGGKHLQQAIMGKAPIETVSGRISPKSTKWGPKSNMLVGYFLPRGQNNPIGFFSPVGFFMGHLIGVKTPQKPHGDIIF
jgi:hypothetical protein